LGGADLHGDPVVAADSIGRHTVFAATPRSVLAWTQARPGAPFSGPLRTGLPPTTLALSATADAGGDGIRAGDDGDGDRDGNGDGIRAGDGGGVRLWYRAPVTGEVRSARFTGGRPGTRSTAEKSLRATSPMTATGMAGFGPVSAGEELLAVRSRTGMLATAPAVPGTNPGWTESGFLFAGAPAVVPGGVAAIGLDGTLHWTPAAR
ncbi:hypothetical protein ACWGI8_38050, partial [Streptomyces sp. NPDC054841]